MAELRVLNTRPADRAAGLDQALTSAGFGVVNLPLLELEPLALEAAALPQVRELDRYRAVFVVSPTAARLGLRLLADWWPQWPVDLVWIAVGEATARELRDEGLSPVSPEDETSEGVLALPVLRSLGDGDRVLVLRGEGGRNLVREWLTGRSVRVDYLDVYRRRLPAGAAARWREISALARPDVVVLTSGESLRHWREVAGAIGLAIPVLVVSKRLAELAAAAGCREVLLAPGASAPAVVSALQAWRGGAGHGIDGTPE